MLSSYEKGFYERMKMELELPQPSIENIVVRDSYSWGPQGANFNNFVRSTLSKYINAKHLVTLINQKFTEETASKPYQRQAMLDKFTTFWGDTSFADRFRYFFNVWDQHKILLDFSRKVDEQLSLLEVQQIPYPHPEYRIKKLVRLVESCNNIHKHLSGLKVHELSKTLKFQDDKVGSLVRLVNLYESFLIIVTSQQQWNKLEGMEKAHHQFYKENRFSSQLTMYMDSIIDQRNKIYQIKHKIKAFEKQNKRFVEIENFQHFQGIILRGLQSFQSLQSLVDILGDLVGKVKEKKRISLINIYKIGHELIREYLNKLIMEVEQLYENKESQIKTEYAKYDGVTIFQMKDFINDLSLSLDKSSQYTHLANKMKVVRERLASWDQQTKHIKHEIQVLKQYIQEMTKEVDKVFYSLDFGEELQQYVYIDKKDSIQIPEKMKIIQHFIKNKQSSSRIKPNNQVQSIKKHQLRERSMFEDVPLIKQNQISRGEWIVREEAKGGQKRGSMEESAFLQKSINFQQEMRKDRIALLSKENEIKDKIDHIQKLNQQISELKLQLEEKDRELAIAQEQKPKRNVGLQARRYYEVKIPQNTPTFIQEVRTNETLSKEIESMKEENLQLKEKIGKLQEQIAEERNSKKEISLKYKQYSERNAHLQQTLLDDEQKVCTLEEQLKISNLKCNDLSRQLQNLRREYEEKNKLQDPSIAIEMLKQQHRRERQEDKQIISQQQLTIASKAEEIQQISQQLQNMSKQHQKLQQKIIQLQDEKAQKDRQISMHEQNSKKYSRKIQQLESTIQAQEVPRSMCQDKMSEQKQEEVLAEEQKTTKMVPYTQALFNEDIFFKREYLKQTLVSHIQKYSKSRIFHTALLHKYDPRNKANFHQYIDNVMNLCLVIKTKYSIFAGFYPGQLKEKQTLSRGGLLVSVTNDRSYTLHPKKAGDKTIYRGMVYDQYYAIFGNAQIRVKTGMKTVFSNFGINNSFFNHRGDKVDVFLNEGEMREVEFQHCEFYKILFEKQRLNYQ